MAPRRRRTEVEEEESEEEAPQTQRRRRAPLSDDSEEEEVEENGDEMEVDGDGIEQVVKKLVRYALACEYQRISIKKAALSEKVFMKRRVPFNRIFEMAQKQLRFTFGMELVELPAREKLTLREKQAAQKKKSNAAPPKSWILTTILPSQYRKSAIIPPSMIGSPSEEASYAALCTMIISIILMSPEGSIIEAKLMSYLKRLNADENMPMDKTAIVMKKMINQGYLIRSVEKSDADETVTWHVGPRGKIEIGNKGVQGFVEEVYGNRAPEDLEQRIHKSLRIEPEDKALPLRGEESEEDEATAREDPGPSTQRQRRSGRQRRVDDD